jgi:hypothetical protein
VVEEVDALDDLVGRHLARDCVGSPESSLNCMPSESDVCTLFSMPRPITSTRSRTTPREGALVLEIVQEGGHADGEYANDKRDHDETDANPPHDLPTPPVAGW